jgi:hypothetical protein
VWDAGRVHTRSMSYVPLSIHFLRRNEVPVEIDRLPDKPH